MKEVDVRRKIFRMLRLMGYWPITQTDATICPRCKTKVKPPIGRPDILVLNPVGRTAVVEVKVLRRNDASFSFDRISPEQRRWLDKWEADGGLGYIALGAIRPHKSKDYLEHLWLVDWYRWKEIEGLVSPIQNSIPLVAGKGMRRELQVHHYDLTTLLDSWQVQHSSKEWKLPAGHTVLPQEAH
jgi:hypothetical protein